MSNQEIFMKGFFEHPVNREVIRHLKRFGVVLDQRKKYIQELTLFVYHQPDVSILKQPLDKLPEDFDLDKLPEDFDMV